MWWEMPAFQGDLFTCFFDVQTHVSARGIGWNKIKALSSHGSFLKSEEGRSESERAPFRTLMDAD